MLSVVTSVTLFQTFGPQHHPDPEQYNLSHLTFHQVRLLQSERQDEPAASSQHPLVQPANIKTLYP